MKQVLIDTNILIHSKNTSSPEHGKAKADLLKLQQAGYDLIVCPQVLRECYKIMTTPTDSSRPGWGLTPKQALQEIGNIMTTYGFAQDSHTVFIEWQTLVDTYSVIGINTHDTNIVACMKTNGIGDILTYNTKDFMRFKAIINLHP